MKAFFRQFLALASAALLTFVFSGPVMAQPASPNIGVFDLQKVFSDSQKGKDVKKALEADSKKRQDDLKKKQDEITKLEEELNKLTAELGQLASSDSANKEDLRKKNDDLRKKIENRNNKVKAHQEQFAKYAEEMRQAEEQKMKPLMDSVVKIVGDKAKEKGYLIVLETQRAGVVFIALEAMDMTNDIIKALDKP